MKDFVGNELNIGDDVVYIFHSKTSSRFVRSKIKRFTDKCVFMTDGKRKEWDKVIKINQQNHAFIDRIEVKIVIDNRAITEYKLIVKICDENECAKYDPFGLCYIDDCLSCPNARVKIIRQDNTVMRDDFKSNKNGNFGDKIWEYKRMLEREGVELFEKMYNITFTKFQKCYLNRLLKRNKKK